jgi:hypothetical protein
VAFRRGNMKREKRKKGNCERINMWKEVGKDTLKGQ